MLVPFCKPIYNCNYLCLFQKNATSFMGMCIKWGKIPKKGVAVNRFSWILNFQIDGSHPVICLLFQFEAGEKNSPSTATQSNQKMIQIKSEESGVSSPINTVLNSKYSQDKTLLYKTWYWWDPRILFTLISFDMFTFYYLYDKSIPCSLDQRI